MSERDATSLRDLSPQQWKSGIAAWLGWLFDGLDMHLYVLVAAPFVALLLSTTETNPLVRERMSWIQAAFLFGWAFGGGFFGLIGDRLGRSRALMLTILTYALFTGLSYFAQTWWQLMLFRFLAALGIGGEWAVGASLLSETWPKKWRPWLAAVLQTGVNLGVMIACVAAYVISYLTDVKQTVFLVGIIPALLVLWIRRAVPEPEEWHQAKKRTEAGPSFFDLFRGPVRRISLLTLCVCALSLTAHWAFLFWSVQHLRNHPDVKGWTEPERSRLTIFAFWFVMGTSIVGNFVAAVIARRIGYRRAIAMLCLGYFACMAATYADDWPLAYLWVGLAGVGICQGVFGLFTMYLPPLFPTLLRTTGAGFCYNIGRIAAGVGTVVFGLYAKVGDYRLPLLYAGCLFVPAALIAWLLPDPPDERKP